MRKTRLIVTLFHAGKGKGVFVNYCAIYLEQKLVYEVTFKVISREHGNDYENNIFRIHLKISVSSSVLYLFMEINSI